MQPLIVIPRNTSIYLIARNLHVMRFLKLHVLAVQKRSPSHASRTRQFSSWVDLGRTAKLKLMLHLTQGNAHAPAEHHKLQLGFPATMLLEKASEALQLQCQVLAVHRYGAALRRAAVAQFEVRLRVQDNSGAWRLVVASPTGQITIFSSYLECMAHIEPLLNPN